jgi:predicted ATPase
VQVDLTLKNYRCFPDSHPARLAVRKGFTALVGPNNGGKSSLLRFFFEFRDLLSRLASEGEFELALRGDSNLRGFNLNGVSDAAAVFSNENDRSLVVEMDFSPSPDDELTSDSEVPAHLTVEVPRNQSEFRVLEFRTAGRIFGRSNEYRITRDSQNRRMLVHTQEGALRVVVDPMFSTISGMAQTTYLGAFRNAINVGGRESYFDIIVGEQFLRAWRQLKTGNSRQQANAAFRLTQAIRDMFGFKQMEINTTDDNRSLQVFIDERPLWLDEIGSGVAQFILVLASLATRQQAYVLVDEPELNLHPSLQVEFLTTIGTYASEGVIFGSHSMGLARAVAQQVYALKRFREGVSEMRLLDGMPRLAEFLGEMSFSGYRELGFQKVLLVEGPSDVTTVKQFLRKRQLDHKIVALPLGGGSMINAGREPELEEVKRISTDLHVLIDSERAEEGAPLSADRAAFVASCEKMQIQCHVLRRRAMENYFSDRAIKSVKSPAYRALAAFEHLKDVTPAWSKQENWRIAREMTLEELAGTDLGTFIQSL